MQRRERWRSLRGTRMWAIADACWAMSLTESATDGGRKQCARRRASALFRSLESLESRRLLSGDSALRDVCLGNHCRTAPLQADVSSSHLDSFDILQAADRNVLHAEPAQDPNLPLAATIAPMFQPSQLVGSLVGQSRDLAAIETPGDSDSFPMQFDAGQALTIVVRPDSGLQLEVSLTDGGGNVLAQIVSGIAGEAVLLQTIPMSQGGDYAVRTLGLNGTTGAYEAQFIINAAIENEAFIFGSSNDTLETAQTLNGSWIEFPGGQADRAAIVGVREPDLVENFELGFLPAGEWTTASSAPIGYLEVSAEFDAADGIYSLLMGQTQSGTKLIRNEATWKVDLAGFDEALLSFSHTEFGDEEHALPATFVGSADGDGVSISQDGLRWHRVFQSPHVAFGEWVEETVNLVTAASSAGISLDAEFFIRFQQTDDSPIPSDGRAYDAIRIDTSPSSAVRDWYQFDMEDGQSATIAMKEFGPGFTDSTVNLYDATGSFLASGNPARDVEYLIANYLDQTNNGRPDGYFLEVLSPAYDYELLVTRNIDFDRERNSSISLAQSTEPSDQLLGYVSSELRATLDPLESFAGPDFTNLTPPDPTLAVGPEQLVALVNSDIAIYDKDSGNELFRQSISLQSGFFGPVGAQATVFDPWVIFDDDSQRFFIVGIDIERLTLSNMYIAVSTTATPRDGSDWHKYKLDFTHHPEALGLGTGPHFPDYEKLGVNDDAIFISANYFPILTGSGNYAGVTAIDKTALVNGNAPRIVYREYFEGFSVFPLNQFDSGTTQYFAEASQEVDDLVRIHAVTDVMANPRRHTYDLIVPDFLEPTDVPQLGGGTAIEAVGKRIMTGVWRDGSAWFAHGVIDPAAGDGENVARWYEVATNNFPAADPELIQFGNVDPGPGIHAWMPALAVDADSNMAIGFSYGGESLYTGAAYTGRLSTDPLGETDGGVHVFADGLANYDNIDGSGRNRWGDYSGLAVDPSDDAKFWVFNLYASTLDRWATEIASFRLKPTPDSDFVQILARVGDRITINTFTPLDGPGLLRNELDPELRLFDPAGVEIGRGVNGPDGRNESLFFIADATGTYYLEIFSDETEGTYVVDIDGANGQDPGPLVVSSVPNNDELVSTFPRFYRVNLTETIESTTLQPTDLTVNGVPALSVRVEGNSLNFLLNQAVDNGSGEYVVQMPAGAIADLQGRLLGQAIRRTFRLDTLGPRILATQWNDGDLPADRTFSPGELVFEANLDEDVFVLASARRGPLAPGADDIILTNLATGKIVEEAALLQNNDTDTFRAEYEGLAEGNYELRLVAGDGAFEDNAGNSLNGEPIGSKLDGTITGDDAPGGDYRVSFVVDVEREPIAPFVSQSTRGSLVSSSLGNSGFVNLAGDVDEFVFFGEPGQTIAVQLTQDKPAAATTLELLTVGGTVLATKTAAEAGFILPARSLPTLGNYLLRVTSDQPTHYQMDVWSNTQLEPSFADISSDQPLALDPSAVSLAAASRWAAVGASERRLDYAVNNDASKFVDIAEAGLELPLTDDQEVTIDSTIENELLPAGLITVGNNGGLIAGGGVNLYFQNLPLPAPDLGRGLFVYWDDLGTAVDGVYADTRVIDGVDALVVQWNELPHFPQLQLSGITFQAQIFESGPLLARFVYPDVEFGDVTLDGGATATIGYQESDFVGFPFLFGGADLQPAILPNRLISNNDVVELAWAADVDDYTLDLSQSVGRSLDVVLSGLNGADYSAELVEIIGPNGSVLASSSTQPLAASAENFDVGILDFQVPNLGNHQYTIRVSSRTFAQYGLTVTESMVFDTEPNNGSLDTLRDLNSQQLSSSALGYLDGSIDSDRYTLTANAGQLIRLGATPVFDNAKTTPRNEVDLQLQVIAADGTTVLASSATDGRTAEILWSVTVSEQVTVVVTSSAGAGSYLLSKDPISANPATVVLTTRAQLEGDDGTTDFVFNVTRSHNNDAVRLDVATFEISATESVDYLPVQQTFRFAPGGELTQSIAVSVVGDLDVELSERFGLRITNLVGATANPRSIFTTIVDDDEFGPRVQSVRVGSTVWTQAFRDAIDDASLGYLVSTDNRQAVPIPWVNVNQLMVQFDQDVSASITADSIQVQTTRENGSRSDVSSNILRRTFDPETNTLTLTFGRSFPPGTVTLTLRDSIDFEGNALDGEWVSGQAGPSGDRRVGGDFVFNFTMLPGDVDGNNGVLPADITQISQALFGVAGQQNYVARADVNGSGVVDGDDLTAVRSRVFTILQRPPGSPIDQLAPFVVPDADRNDQDVIDEIFGNLGEDDVVLRVRNDGEGAFF